MLNQPIIRNTAVYFSGKCYHPGERFVICPKCNEEVSLSLSYFDPYFKGGCQVHKSCLSDQRTAEITG